MREIEGSIFSHLNLNPDKQDKREKINVASTEPLLVDNFVELVKKIAILSFHNKDHLLFFRGQREDHLNRNDNSSFYPSIYRTKNGENLSKELLNIRFKVLEQASTLLIKKFEEHNILDSISELKRRKFIQWSILQHYEVCETPLLDLTQSLRVACSFALQKNQETGYIFVFGLPYITNRITINSEQDIVNIRLINICPPQALRPYFQEGNLVGTADILSDYEERSELDFKRRLIAKFKITNSKDFWQDQDSLEKYLMPDNDQVQALCEEIKNALKEENNIEAMFPGKWLNEYELKDGRRGKEIIEIKNGNQYYTHGRHFFNLESVNVDKVNGIIKFRKVSATGDGRKAFNTLKIENENKYEGTETSGTRITYTRIE
jgi:hypothetical protein